MRMIWLGGIVMFLSATGVAHAQESMMQKVLSPSTNSVNQGQAVSYSAPAQPAPVMAPVLPLVPVVAPAARLHPRNLPCTQSPPSGCDKVGFLRGIFASGHAFFQMPTGHGFCGIH